MKKLLRINDLHVVYGDAHGQRIHAVRGAKLEIDAGETVGLVGESGCGKSSLAKAIMQFIKPAAGEIYLNDDNLLTVSKKRLRRLRPLFQMIFQGPVSSLNPKRTVEATLLLSAKVPISSAAKEHGICVDNMLEQVGLSPSLKNSYPHQLSGGQCQRVQIARALLTEPRLLVCDEPVSSLDVSIQAQIVRLLHALQKKNNLAILFISHDLSVVRQLCDRVVVMYRGTVCESSTKPQLFAAPRHPYTRMLLDAVPSLERKWPEQVTGEKRGAYTDQWRAACCVFEPRCHYAQKICKEVEPKLQKRENDVWVACHFPLPTKEPAG